MFITQPQVILLLFIYVAILVIFAVAVLNDASTNSSVKMLKLLLLLFLPVLGILILSADYVYNRLMRTKRTH